MPTKIPIFYCSSFWSPYFTSLHFRKNIPSIPNNTPFLSPLVILTSLLVHTATYAVPTKSPFLPQPLPNLGSVKGSVGKGVLWGHCFNLSASPRFPPSSQSFIHFFTLIFYRSDSKNWCITGSGLWWRCLQSEWETINFTTLLHTLNIFPWLSYPCSPPPSFLDIPLSCQNLEPY